MQFSMGIFIMGVKDNKIALLRDDKGRLLKGTPPGPGRPKGSFSLTTKITKILEDNPEQLGEIIGAIFEKHPDLVWKMIDGMPRGESPALNVENLENLTIVVKEKE